VTYLSKKRKENEGSKMRSKGSKGSKARFRRSEGSKVRSKWSEGSKACSKEVRARMHTQKRGRVRKCTTLDGQEMHYVGWSRAQRCTWKEMRARRRPKNDDRRLESALKKGRKRQRFFRWPNSHGRPAQVKKFSKLKNFQKQLQSLAISSWPSTWWIPPEFSLIKFAKLIVQCLKV